MRKNIEKEILMHTSSTSYFSHSESFVERKNRTPIDKVRAIPTEVQHPWKFLGKEIDQTKVFHNRTVSSILNNITSYESLFGKVPDSSKFGIYILSAYRLVDEQVRTSKPDGHA